MSFQIGTTEAGMVTLESLGLRSPQNDPVYFSKSIDTGDLAVCGAGIALDVWMWAGMTIMQRNALKTYCPNKSAEVYISTLTSDNVYKTYRAVMIWAERELQKSNFVFDLSVQFRLLEEL